MTEPGPRTRSQSDVETITTYYMGSPELETTPAVLMESGTYEKGVERVFNDVVVENFYSRRQNGEVFFNDMKDTKTTYDCTPGNQYVQQIEKSTGDKLAYRSGPMIEPTTRTAFASLAALIPYDDEEEKELVMTEAYANVDSSQVSALVSLGELKETKEMLFQLIRKMGKLQDVLEDIVRISRNKSFSKKDFTNISSLWLEYRYGWYPLISDIKAWVETCVKLAKNPLRQTFRGYTPTRLDEDTIEWEGDIISWHQIQVSGIKRWSKCDNWSAGVLTEQRVDGFADTFGITKIPQAAWDLTRLSFVWDWFFNIADFIASWVPDTLWAPLGGWVTLERKTVEEARDLNCTYEDTYAATITINQLPTIISRTIETRQRFCDVSRSSFPQFRLEMDLRRYIDAIALSRGSVYKTLDRVRDAVRRIK